MRVFHCLARAWREAMETRRSVVVQIQHFSGLALPLQPEELRLLSTSQAQLCEAFLYDPKHGIRFRTRGFMEKYETVERMPLTTKLLDAGLQRRT